MTLLKIKIQYNFSTAYASNLQISSNNYTTGSQTIDKRQYISNLFNIALDFQGDRIGNLFNLAINTCIMYSHNNAIINPFYSD